MIEGTVSPELEPIINIKIRSADGVETGLSAILDTGFSDFLTLPPSLLAELGLEQVDVTQIRLADCSFRRVGIHQARIWWDDEWLAIPVQASDCDPLLGMSLLHKHFLSMEVVNRGAVTVEKTD